eukprot:GDKJ01018173.1.p1 GENE.GDKJ01018173.1~~GDKJ01018173.1.p1  ORF type:complete len:209 (-),score=13.29 GDKJ01018173.1:218-763(-)
MRNGHHIYSNALHPFANHRIHYRHYHQRSQSSAICDDCFRHIPSRILAMMVGTRVNISQLQNVVVSTITNVLGNKCTSFARPQSYCYWNADATHYHVTDGVCVSWGNGVCPLGPHPTVQPRQINTDFEDLLLRVKLEFRREWRRNRVFFSDGSRSATRLLFTIQPSQQQDEDGVFDALTAG